MADELHTPNHRWYQGRYHIPLAKEDHSKQWIFDSGIQKIDAWIASINDEWLLETGVWADGAIWVDTETWNDGA
jgi:hypothetical protein